jgi:hypothetical protein
MVAATGEDGNLTPASSRADARGGDTCLDKRKVILLLQRPPTKVTWDTHVLPCNARPKMPCLGIVMWQRHQVVTFKCRSE